MNTLIKISLFLVISHCVYCQVPKCRFGSPLKDVFCGRGPNRQDCPDNYTCNIAPNDRFAVCCPNDPCIKCKSDEKCVIRKCNGLRCRLPFQARCLKRKLICPQSLCKLFCEFGYQKDKNNCTMCKCVDPCEGKCGPEGVCKIQRVECAKAPCDPVVTCEDKSMLESIKDQSIHDSLILVNECPLAMCLMRCEFGFQRDKNNCTICKCLDPCEGKCGSEKVCIVNRVNCQQGVCTPEITCSSPISINKCPLHGCRMFCEFGYQKDKNNCTLCKCVDPCENKCKPNEFCSVKKTDCIQPLCEPLVICEPSPEPPFISIKTCPDIKPDLLGNCSTECNTDEDCDIDKKCCSNGCGKECMGV